MEPRWEELDGVSTHPGFAYSVALGFHGVTMTWRDAWKGGGLLADLAGLGVPGGLVRDVTQGCSSTKTQRKEHSKQVGIESD